MSQKLQKRDGDPRVAELLGTYSSSTKIALIGFPFDRGVQLNFGRPGAASAPPKIRERLLKLTPDARNAKKFKALLGKTADRGNLKLPGGIKAAHQILASEVASLLNENITPIILGGGHETTYGHFLGFARCKEKVSLINFDAHPDVRERIKGQSHSGSSFRDALEDPSRCAKDYTVFGLQPHSVANSHLEYLKSKRAKLFFADECSKNLVTHYFSKLKGSVLVSFDIDCVDQAFAPGTSAPCTGGFSPKLILHAAYTAGRCRAVRSLDIVEVNPQLDRDDQTSRLAALIIWNFLRGRAELG